VSDFLLSGVAVPSFADAPLSPVLASKNAKFLLSINFSCVPKICAAKPQFWTTGDSLMYYRGKVKGVILTTNGTNEYFFALRRKAAIIMAMPNSVIELCHLVFCLCFDNIVCGLYSFVIFVLEFIGG
jgi:hypothetical protein